MEKYTTIVEKVRNEKKFSNFIFDFNNNIKPYIVDLNTFFSNNDLLKDEFISSVVDTFDDNSIRFFVPEVNSSEDDLQLIIFDLLKYDVKFNFYG